MSASADVTHLPLSGLRVVEFVHMVMGPSCGLVLADLGAEVIKVEPLEGDNTRRLMGAGAGFYPIFNRNKKSIAINLKHPQGMQVVHQLIQSADVLTENFRPGALDALGLGWEALSNQYPRLVYCAMKGFLSGPYEHRPALDEVVQMMGGLAYMTGLPDRPLRVGSSVNDIMGGMFGAFGTVLALKQRDRTGKGGLVESALFESVVFLMGQHLAITAMNGTPPPPMPERVSSWAVYEVFNTSDAQQVFIGITSDGQWKRFCEFFKQPGLAADPKLATNNQRIEARPWLVPKVAEFQITTSDIYSVATIDNKLAQAAKNDQQGFVNAVLPEAERTALQQELRRMSIPVTLYSPGGRRTGTDKVSRANSVAPVLEAGMVWAPDTDWAEELVEECAAFPNGDNDDMVDVTTMALMRFRQGNFISLQTDDQDEGTGSKDLVPEYY